MCMTCDPLSSLEVEGTWESSGEAKKRVTPRETTEPEIKEV